MPYYNAYRCTTRKYETPAIIKSDEHDDCFHFMKDKLDQIVNHFFYPIIKDSRILNNIHCTSMARTQDFSFINKFMKDIPANPRHLDIGPGLGTHAIYSQEFMGSAYIAIEAHDYMYEVQRLIYRYIKCSSGSYYDTIMAETLGKDKTIISNDLRNMKGPSISHVPSWHFSLIEPDSVDLITATFVLNEVTPSGIMWLLSNANSVMKEGGYFYIRDSHKLKPNRHSINYDLLLEDIGFEKLSRVEITNRVDMFGIPRAYRKKKNQEYSFEELFDKYLGRFCITHHGGEYMQNLPEKNDSQ